LSSEALPGEKDNLGRFPTVNTRMLYAELPIHQVDLHPILDFVLRKIQFFFSWRWIFRIIILD